MRMVFAAATWNGVRIMARGDENEAQDLELCIMTQHLTIGIMEPVR